MGVPDRNTDIDETLGALSDSFKAAPVCAGLTVNFEIYAGFQINTTLTALVFGESQ